jgi:hypothetical protein
VDAGTVDTNPAPHASTTGASPSVVFNAIAGHHHLWA